MNSLLDSVSFPDNFEGRRDHLIIHLLYTTGIRRAELIGLSLSDIDLEGNTVKVLGKRNKERLVPLLPETRTYYLDYLDYRDDIRPTNGVEAVFLTARGKPIYPTLVYRVVNRYLKKVSTKTKVSPHMLRHTFATHLLANGADLNSVKELLGHTSLAATQVYTHTGIAALKKTHQMAHPRSGKKY